MARDSRLLAGLALALTVGLLAGGSASAASTGPLVEHFDGSSWTRVAVPGGGQLSAVTALSPKDVWTFGSFTSRSPFAEHRDGNSWTRMRRPVPAGAENVALQNASADASDDLWLVGYWEGITGPPLRSLVEHWDGNAWHIVSSATTPGYATLGGVRALSPGNVWAVGAYGVAAGRRIALRTLVQHWNGKTWTRVASPDPASPGSRGAKVDFSLTSVDGVSADDVWAVGSYSYYAANGSHTTLTLVVHWDGSGWQVVASHGLPTTPDVQLNAVASTANNDVWVAGTDYSEGPPSTLVEHWNGNALSRVQSPNPPGADIALTAISADSPNDVWAVGTPGFP